MGRGVANRVPSVRDRTAATAAPGASPALAVLGLVVTALAVHGFRAVGGAQFGGDLLYHQALINELLRGIYPLAGPYAGLPTYYPPGFHALVALTAAIGGLDPARAVDLLTLAWLPVLPLGTYLLARRVTGRPWVAVLAVALTLFAGAYDLRAGRQWVNALFLSGHSAWPLYPRDVVFGLLPFGVLAVLLALDAPRGPRRAAWAAVAGIVFGIAGLVQVQLLAPLPVVIVVAVAVAAARGEIPARAAVLILALSGGVAALIVAPWLADQLAAIARNGGVALDSSETLEPARFGFWHYPRQFGLLLPLAVLGGGVALLWLRRPSGPSIAGEPGRWRPRPIVGGLLLATWAGLAFALGVLYSPDWPLEDALRPQRMWLLASQPAAILAAIGLAALAEEVLAARAARPRLVVPAIVVATLIACVPATVATTRLVAGVWRVPAYAHLDLARDRVPDFAALLGTDGPRRTVLTYEDWSSLAWYQTGEAVVAVEPAGYAKLAFDPARFTALGQAERRAAVGTAFRGDLGAVVALADEVGADRIVLARDQAGRWGLLDVAVAVAAPGVGTRHVGNGWDGLVLEPGDVVTLATELPGAPARVELRLARRVDHPEQRGLVIGAMAPGSATVEQPLTAQGGSPFEVLTTELDVEAGATLVIEARTPLILQSVRGFVSSPEVPAGWAVSRETPEAVVLERLP